MADIDTDILIIGGGVAGSAAAYGLSKEGYKVLLLEKSEKPQDTARGDHIQPAVSEILGKWNILEAFFNNGARKRAGSLWFDEDANFLMDANVSKLEIPEPYFMFMNHEDISNVFVSSAEENKGFSFLCPILSCAHIDTNANESIFEIKLKDGETQTAATKMIIIADGVASNMGRFFEFERSAFRYEKALAVLFSDEYEADEFNNLRTYLTDRGIVTMIPRAKGGCKIGLTIGRDEIKEWKKMTSKEHQNFIGGLVPIYENLKMYSAGIYPPSMIIAENWTKDNIVLMGDACHGLHPGRSQGMNTTIKCIDHLLDLLPPNETFEKKNVIQSLSQYQKLMKSNINELLEANHAMGISMDNFDKKSKVQEIEKFKFLEKNFEEGQSYRMKSAGYGVF
ncbi:MAG TPA: FAD-dependent oxidoreductase [Gammaproteobacteria bacterium]|nr:FAD-dependent oxidoreductase [Gammaproteobacteria bacterium]|tara:strand:- start:16134 stop:17318 length:1185 start_codon:yes stop_codon:yes gene_type:complete